MSARLERRVLAKTAAYTIKPPQDRPGLTFTNRGATGSVTFTLPTPNAGVKGWWYDFLVHADQSLIVAGAAAGAIATSGNAAANNVSFETASKKIGGRILAMCDGTQWICVGIRAGSGFCVNGTELKLDDSVTAGTALASRPVVLDAFTAIAGLLITLGAAVTVQSAPLVGIAADVTGAASGTTQNTWYPLSSITIPANALSVNGKGLDFEFFGTLAANANAKDFRLHFGAAVPTLVTGNTGNATVFSCRGSVYRTGAGAQRVVAELLIGVTVAATIDTTAAADETTAWTFSIESQNTAAAAASATGHFGRVNFRN
jgi:hypothetical protein